MTQKILVAAVVVLLAIDAALLLGRGVQSTFSVVVLQQSRRHPVIPFGAGVLCGHLFWPQPIRRKQ